MNDDVKACLYKSLEATGLRNAEIDLYSVALSLGPCKISTAAEHLGISRPSAYKAASRLEQRGLGQFSGNGKHFRLFTVGSPVAILETLRQRSATTEQLIHHFAAYVPKLLAEHQNGSILRKMSIIEGKEPLKRLHARILDEAKNELRLFGSRVPLLSFLSLKEIHEWSRKRVRKNIRYLRVIVDGVSGEPPLELDTHVETKANRETRTMSDMPLFPPTAFHLYKNNMILWQPHMAVHIEDPLLSGMTHAIFGQLWKGGKTSG